MSISFFGRSPYVDEPFHYRNICKVIMPHSALLIGSDWSLLAGGALFFLKGGAFFWIWHLSAPQGNPACTLSHLDLSSGPFTELTSPCTTLCNADCTFWLREGVNGKKTFSFGHCPNHLNPPPSPQFGQLGPLFSEVKIQDLKVSLELKLLYILYNILYICNLKNS